MIKYGSESLIRPLTQLFNLSLQTTVFPKKWSTGFVTPIFKSGDKSDPANYRGITLSSCLGKVFTKILNNRLNCFLEDNNILHPSQSGFRRNARTADHVLLLKTLIMQAKKKKQKIYACFVDLKKAFDTVWHRGLLYTLRVNGCGANFTNLIESMYLQSESCIKVNECVSAPFAIQVGTRQGCPLSPTLFNLYINKLASFLENIAINPPTIDDQAISALFYADDIVLLSNSPSGLQSLVHGLHRYCKKWKLMVNTAKTKFMIFNSTKIGDYKIMYGDTHIKQCTDYVYLGITFTPSGSFKKAKKVLAGKARKALFMLKQSINKYGTARPELMMNLFDKMITPILLYCSEIWGLSDMRKEIGSLWDLFEHGSPSIDSIHTKFCKQILSVRQNTNNLATLSELGRVPLVCIILFRTVKYLLQKLNVPANLLVSSVLINMKFCNSSNNIPNIMKQILNTLGLWDLSKDATTKYKIQSVIHKLKLKTREAYNKYVSHTSKNDAKLEHYWSIRKIHTAMPTYIKEIQNVKFRQALTKFRLASHSLPIETGRWHNVPRAHRLCKLCNINAIGDELHCSLSCSHNDISRWRTQLFNNIIEISPQFDLLSKQQQFYYLLHAGDSNINQMGIFGKFLHQILALHKQN